ncbi:hypothetical protein [Thalassospira sp.]|uniref:hypothetical protein n=1 Tax=Thalassospira sp. TaxID=1912094 RepID=UPI001B0F31BB|nr:hypothetical protein [Thalassospira sp.]MBO6808462.1 hypothetical protein [Thalassospira sp.]MBO6839840.1 hypothetical protein [Thalassospira sp.]
MAKPEVPGASVANLTDKVMVYQNEVCKLATLGQLGPRIEEYSGTTNVGGVATVNFSENFSSTPIAFSVPVDDGGIVLSATGTTTTANVQVSTDNGNEAYRIIVIGN